MNETSGIFRTEEAKGELGYRLRQQVFDIEKETSSQ